MNSFLKKLEREGVLKDQTPAPIANGVTSASAPAPAQKQSGPPGALPADVTQLAVDVFQSDAEVIIYAQIPGADLSKIDVSIEGDNDIITIQGEYQRPESVIQKHGEHGEFSLEECVWGKFFRQIILPHEIDTDASDAKMKDGVLILHCPFKHATAKKIKMQITKLVETGSLQSAEKKSAPAPIPTPFKNIQIPPGGGK